MSGLPALGRGWAVGSIGRYALASKSAALERRSLLDSSKDPSETEFVTRTVTLITTGGTIEKIYDESSGTLVNTVSRVHEMLHDLRLEETDIRVHTLMHKDSLDLTDEDRRTILDAVRFALETTDPVCSGVIVLHGTDTLCETGDLLAAELVDLEVPVVLTGAIRPFEMKHSDALQNLTEAMFATGVMPAGVWLAAHGRAFRFPGVRKDPQRQTFVRAD